MSSQKALNKRVSCFIVGSGIFLILSSLEVCGARPLSTDDAAVIAPAEINFEFGYEYVDEREVDNTHQFKLSFRQGITPRLDLTVATPYALEPESGFEQGGVKLKFLLKPQDSKGPALATAFTAFSGSSSYLMNTLCSWKNRDLTFHFNLGYLASGIPGIKGITFYSAAGELPLTKKLTSVAELCGSHSSDVENPDPWELLGGFKYLLKDWLNLDAGVNLGLNSDAPYWRIVWGFTAKV